MTSSGRRKKHGLPTPTEKSTGRGTAPTVAKNMGYRRKKHHRLRKHTLPMQKTWPAVAKNMPSHQDRRKKHPRPLQKTPPTGTVAKNTKTSHRRKKHELPTQKTRNPISTTVEGFSSSETRRHVIVLMQWMAEGFQWDFEKGGLTSDWLNIRSTIIAMSSKLNAKALSELATCTDLHA